MSNFVCNSLYSSTAAYSGLLSKDKRRLGLILLDGGGNSGRMSYQLLVFKRTHMPIEAGKDDYYGKIKEVNL